MNSLQNWGIPIFTSFLVHTAIMLLPVQYDNQREKNDVAEITFRLVSLPQESQAPPVEHAVYQPKRKPSPPKMTHMQQQPHKPVPKKIARIPVLEEAGAATDEDVDPAPESPPVDLAAVTHTQAGSSTQGNMPADPVVLSTELSVICPERTTPTYPKTSQQIGEYGDVVLRLEVNESGVVRSAQVVNSSGYKRQGNRA